MKEPDFWDNTQKAKQITKEVSNLRDKKNEYKKIKEIEEDLTTFKILLEEEENKELLQEAVSKLKEYKKFIEKAETRFLLSEEMDKNSAVLTIHPGAGGTESQDWAEMLFRMYNRWAEKQDFSKKIIDYQPGEEAGIKSVTMEIDGEYAYGYLKCEIGIHRLVRISPFNAQRKRQTSFASVFVYPMVEDDIEVEINSKDIKIDTYKASGAGGQHVNTTDSAVRITHLPTNIIVQCQNERSQIKNRETAMKLLKARLYQHYREQKEAERQKLEDAKSEIGWGNQIRSYVFHPYQMVKDHRTNHETGNTSAVMDGDITEFINVFLKYRAKKENE